LADSGACGHRPAESTIRRSIQGSGRSFAIRSAGRVASRTRCRRSSSEEQQRKEEWLSAAAVGLGGCRSCAGPPVCPSGLSASWHPLPHDAQPNTSPSAPIPPCAEPLTSFGAFSDARLCPPSRQERRLESAGVLCAGQMECLVRSRDLETLRKCSEARSIVRVLELRHRCAHIASSQTSPISLRKSAHHITMPPTI
jgi:hypothetical protein